MTLFYFSTMTGDKFYAGGDLMGAVSAYSTAIQKALVKNENDTSKLDCTTLHCCLYSFLGLPLLSLP
jgi:hypothetical protein